MRRMYDAGSLGLMVFDGWDTITNYYSSVCASTCHLSIFSAYLRLYDWCVMPRVSHLSDRLPNLTSPSST